MKKIVSYLLSLAIMAGLLTALPEKAAAETASDKLEYLASGIGENLMAFAPASGAQNNAKSVSYTRYEVSTYEDVDKYLERDGNYELVLTKDIDVAFGKCEVDTTQAALMITADVFTAGAAEIAFSGTSDCWRPQYTSYEKYNPIFLGKGNKKLNLNGHKFFASYPDVTDEYCALFYVKEGVDFEIRDDSDKGVVYLNGYICDSSDYDYFKNEHWGGVDPQRDIVRVEGGSFTLNGGTLDGGRSKLEYGFVGLNSVIKGEDDSATDYTGSASKYVNSTAIHVESGEVTINRGTVRGRGFEDILNSRRSSWGENNKKNGAIEVKSGKLTINEGHISAKGGADCLQIAKGAECVIHSGKFSLHRNDALFCGRSDHQSDLRIYTIEDSPKYGQLGIPEGAIADPDNTWVSYYTGKGSGKALAKEAKWKTAFSDKVENKHGADDYEPHIVIYPDGGYTTLTADKCPDLAIAELDPRVEGQLQFSYSADSKMSFVPMDVRLSAGWKRRYEYFVYDSKGEQLKFTLSEDSHVMEYRRGLNNGGDVLEIESLSHLGHTLMERGYGKTYSVMCVITETYYGASNYEITTFAGRQFITTNLSPVTVYEKTPKDDIILEKKGDGITLSASAYNAATVKWFERNRTTGETKEVDKSNYTVEGSNDTKIYNKPWLKSELTISSVNAMTSYSCVFSNALGSASSDWNVSYTGHFINTEDSTVTIYKSLGGEIFQPIEGTLGKDMEFRWNMLGFPITGSDVLKPVAGRLSIAANQDNLVGAKYLLFTCDIIRKSDGKVIETSPMITVNYVDSRIPSSIITGLVIKGLEDRLYVGAEAPLPGDIYFASGSDGSGRDNRIYVSKVSFKDGDLDSAGRLQTASPTLKLDISTTNPGYFVFKGEEVYNSTTGYSYYLPYSFDAYHYGKVKLYKQNADIVHLEVKFDGTDQEPLTRIKDTVILGTDTFEFINGDTVDLPLSFSLKMSDYAKSLGEKHYISKVEKYNAGSTVTPWPASLEITDTGKKVSNDYGQNEPVYNLKGKVTRSAVSDQKQALFAVTVKGDPEYPSGRIYIVSMYYTVLPNSVLVERQEAEAAAAEAAKEEARKAAHVHDFSNWIELNPTSPAHDTEHFRYCKDCVYDSYEESAPHSFELEEILKDPTKDEPGLAYYVCTECGAWVAKYYMDDEGHRITVNLNLGNDIPGQIESFSYNEEYYTLPGLELKENGQAYGKIFLGWKVQEGYLDANGNVVPYGKNTTGMTYTATKPGDKVYVDRDIVCTAIWAESGSCKVSFADVNAKTVSVSKAVITGVTDGQSVSGELSFTIKCEKSCMVLVSEDDGATFTRIKAAETAKDDTYSFSVNVKSDIILAVVRIGDVSLDGTVNSADALQVLRNEVGKNDFNAMQLEIADVSNDKKINSADALQILRYEVGKMSFLW